MVVYFASQGQQHTMIKAKFGEEKHNMGTLSHAKFDPDWAEGQVGTGVPKSPNFTIWSNLHFRPSR